MDFLNSSLPDNSKNKINDQIITYVEVVILSIIFVIALIGNLILIVSILVSTCYQNRNRPRKISRVSFYIMHLSIADIIVAFLSILPQIVWRNSIIFPDSHVLCKFVTFAQVNKITLLIFKAGYG